MPFRKEATLVLLLLSTPLMSAPAAETPLPEALAAPGETVVLTAHAVGMQTAWLPCLHRTGTGILLNGTKNRCWISLMK